MRRWRHSADGKLALLAAAVPGWHQLCSSEQLALARQLDVVDVGAGDLAAPAGCAGQWRTLVLSGAVSTTSPPANYSAGCEVEHGPETALLALTACRLLTRPADVQLPAPTARDQLAEVAITEVPSQPAVHEAPSCRTSRRSS